jgi:hypothetical protein
MRNLELQGPIGRFRPRQLQPGAACPDLCCPVPSRSCCEQIRARPAPNWPVAALHVCHRRPGRSCRVVQRRGAGEEHESSTSQTLEPKWSQGFQVLCTHFPPPWTNRHGGPIFHRGHPGPILCSNSRPAAPSPSSLISRPSPGKPPHMVRGVRPPVPLCTGMGSLRVSSMRASWQQRT